MLRSLSELISVIMVSGIANVGCPIYSEIAVPCSQARHSNNIGALADFTSNVLLAHLKFHLNYIDRPAQQVHLSTPAMATGLPSHSCCARDGGGRRVETGRRV